MAVERRQKSAVAQAAEPTAVAFQDRLSPTEGDRVAGGGNYQTLINSALRKYINSHDESLESTLRRVLREEPPGYGKKKGAPR